ncbi:Alpha/Beta hydrolase protein, partial [Crassisporium funariophilum]
MPVIIQFTLASMLPVVVVLSLSLAQAMADGQTYLPHNQNDVLWTVEFSKSWDVLGPFPIHAREQHFLSPAFPLNISEPIDYSRSWPSSYADGGEVRWDTTSSNDQGDIEVSFPGVRWKELRKSEGWAGLQHHAVLRTTITLHPPREIHDATCIPRILVELKQGSYFTLRPQALDEFSPFVAEWYAGNIYDLERPLPHVVQLPEAPSTNGTLTYDLFISGDYEIRLFGDPIVQGSEVPVQKLNLRVEVQPNVPFLYQPSQNVICDFIDGFAFGDAVGIGIQSVTGWWTVKNIVLKTHLEGISLVLRDSITIAPSQTRVVPIYIDQTASYRDEVLHLEITMASHEASQTLSVTIPITHRKAWPYFERQALRGTFFFAKSTPSVFLAVPPMSEPPEQHRPIIALHGAGVDVIEQDFWMKSLPLNKFNWIVIPTGRTSWGLDWHGPSAQDVWASLLALTAILEKNVLGLSHRWGIPSNTKVILVGHSNGGQGTWYLASRYPDRVIAAIPAAGYIKSQAYIPLTLARSGHYIDPSLRAILESSLTPDDNDLHISNLVDIPILAVHGGADENVPVWHTREAVNVLKTWYPSANVRCVRFREDPGEGHWYPHVFDNPEVQAFVDSFSAPQTMGTQSDSFTLTVSIPSESGPLHGWRIDKLMIPGRLARLQVRRTGDAIFEVQTSNVKQFSLSGNHTGRYELHIDDSVLLLPDILMATGFHNVGPGKWQLASARSFSPQPPSRFQSIFFFFF